MTLKIDDSFRSPMPDIAENKYGTVRIDGKTEREILREYREKHGEERYLRLREKIELRKKKASVL